MMLPGALARAQAMVEFDQGARGCQRLVPQRKGGVQRTSAPCLRPLPSAFDSLGSNLFNLTTDAR